jgi:hypothetical protein
VIGGEKKSTSTDKVEVLRKEIEPMMLDILRRAPEFGSCGLDIVFHDGKPTRITTTVGVSVKPL